jgi:hypothetical protein
MRKMILSVALTIGMIGSTFAQMAIPGEVFAGNPNRFNGRKVTIKNIVIKSESVGTNQSPISGTVNLNVAPGAVGTPAAPNVTPCRAPRGFSKVSVFFKGTPEFNGCFFMADNMKSQMYREIGHEDTEAQITFRGDSRTGYMISFYRLGN